MARGWPVALKNQVLALVTESTLTVKSVLCFVDISEVSSVSFYSAHTVLPFATGGAIARSPLEHRATFAETKDRLLRICEELRRAWPMKIYFDVDPTTRTVDELTNLNLVLQAMLRAVVAVQSEPVPWAELSESRSFYVVNSDDMKDIAISRREDGGVELSFRFSRALPKNLDEAIASLLGAIL